jgi:putative transposase
MLELANIVRAGELRRSTVHRLLLVAHGASARPLRGPATERRSFLPEHAGDLWVGDSMHGPPAIAPDGRLRKAYLLSQIDGATRYVPHSYFALSEGAAGQE